MKYTLDGFMQQRDNDQLHAECDTRIEALERVCEKAIDELLAWDGKASADPATSIGYVVRILRVAVHPEAAKAGASNAK